MGFPEGFVWGTATAAYQIEGAASEDGKGPSIWDQFCREPGGVKSGDSGDIACNHYQLYREDVALMQELGAQAYRLSVSWPRVIPEGVGAVNLKGMDFYDRLVDELLRQGIEPYITLFHWDYPAALHRRGGWLNPDSPEWFAQYARVVVERLSDRVSHWFTINENKIFVLYGYLTGEHAPGVISGLSDVLQINHRVLLAHGKAVQTIRHFAKQQCQVGVAAAMAPRIPATESPADIAAARKGNFVPLGPDPWVESIWQDPVYLGQYPAELD
ncbi:MAG TPA: family 1 glycosylhydrolase, partial [Bacillota bacterium]|nr:family 1 glycosylhydrolase [Bacillota bacterium]